MTTTFCINWDRRLKFCDPVSDILNLYHSLGEFSRFMMFFLFDPENRFDISCKLSLLETIYMKKSKPVFSWNVKTCFLKKNTKSICWNFYPEYLFISRSLSSNWSIQACHFEMGTKKLKQYLRSTCCKVSFRVPVPSSSFFHKFWSVYSI